MLQISRLTKSGGSLVLADGVVANTYPSQVTDSRKMNAVITPIPGEQHLIIPTGPDAKSISVTFPWNMNIPPCAGKTYAESLKLWTCNSIYELVGYGSLVSEIPTGYYLAKNITHSRDKTGLAGGLQRWAVDATFIKIRDEDVTDCPDFEDTTPGNPYTGGLVSPSFTMTNILTSEALTTKLTKISVKHTGNTQSFALYDEDALTILPPLGNTGPVIDITFRTKTVADFNLIKSWAASRSTVVGVTQVAYPEFDIDNAPTYYSRWVLSGLSISRGSASGAGVAGNIIERVITASLTRFWKYDEVGL